MVELERVKRVHMRDILPAIEEEHREIMLSELKKLDPNVERAVFLLRQSEHTDLLQRIQRYRKIKESEEALEEVIDLMRRFVHHNIMGYTID